jgi:hypothetical protein
MEQKILISQKDNYAGNFGEVLRSSAFFWAKNDARIKTTICISNYWKYKNSLDVTVLINLRDLGGKLISRTKANFEASEVCNYTPPADFEGSVEVEAFSTRNLRIPYAAVMAVYECADSISMVHSYARAYSPHEIEEGRTITVGEESCWSLRDSATVTSFCAFHNGAAPMQAQEVTLRIRNSTGSEQTCRFPLPRLNPYQTVIVEPRRYFPQIVEWLAGKPGNGHLSFRLEGGFTRMLCGVRNADWTQLQVTHSNFDYSAHDTDMIRDGILKAYMYTPTVRKAEVRQEIVVYPDTSRGEYTMTMDGLGRSFRTGEIVLAEFADGTGRRAEFTRTDGVLPTRIVTGLRLAQDLETIPAECSLGVAHHKGPPKHFSWMVVSKQWSSMVCWTDPKEIYGGCPADAKLAFNLYTDAAKAPLTRKMDYRELPASGCIALGDIFDAPMRSFGYLTVWCSYAGLVFFSTLQKDDSICIEHSF